MSSLISYRGIELLIDSHKVLLSGAVINLRNKEFSLLEYFMKNIGKVVTRTELLEEVWDRNICCSTNTVDVHVSVLRSRLKIHSDGFDFIHTVHCVGYIFGD